MPADDLAPVLMQGTSAAAIAIKDAKVKDASKSSTPELIDEDDAMSATTEVIEAMSNSDSTKTIETAAAEFIAEQQSGASSDAAAPVAEAGTPASPAPQFTLALPEPVEKATALAVEVVRQWWAQLQPLLQKLMVQLRERSEPMVKASQEAVAKLQLQFKPQTDQAAALVAEWQEKLAPHTAKVMEAVASAKEAVRVQAYEPALAYIATASVYLREHSVQMAALVAEKAALGYDASLAWLEAQKPAMVAAWAATQEHAKSALAALLEWKRQVEPLALAQLQALREKSIELSLKGVEQAKVLSAQAGVKLAELKEAVPPATEAVKEWAASTGAIVQAHPATKAVQAWTDETGKKLQPHVDPILKPVAATLAQWMKILEARWAVVAKQLEAPAEATKQWIVQTAQCVCLPLAKPIKFDAAAEADYPPPVMNPAAQVVD